MVVGLNLTLLDCENLIKTLPIKKAWLVYVAVLQKYGGAESHDWKFDWWQHKCIFEIFEHKFVCINRCRSGSKTRDMSALCVFFRLRGLIPVWMSANRKQLVRSQIYWNENPFVKNFSISINRDFIYLKNGDMFQIFVLKKGLNNDRGPRAHVIFYDEMSQMSEDLVENTREFSGGMDYDGSQLYWIHFSTPEINSPFQMACELFFTKTHDCAYPSWFTEDYIRRIKASISLNKFKQEMLCMFVSMAGCIFDGHIIRGHCPDRLEQKVYYGHDPNSREGYFVAGVKYNARFTAGEVVFLKNFGSGAQGKKLAIEFLSQQSRDTVNCGGVEIETNGVGMPVWDDFCDIGGNGIGMHWDHIDKIRRVNDMNKRMLYIPTDSGRDFVEAWNQINAVSLTEDGTKIDKPKDRPWHFADSIMHACQSQAIIWV